MTRWSAGSGSPSASRKLRCSSGARAATSPSTAAETQPTSVAGRLPTSSSSDRACARPVHGVLGEVQAVEYRLQRQELKPAQEPGLLRRQRLGAKGHAILERSLHPREERVLALLGVGRLPLETGAELLDPALDDLQVGEDQLFLERLDLARRRGRGAERG